MKNSRQLFHIRVRAFDINGLVLDRHERPDPLVDVIVPVKTTSAEIATKRALMKAKSVIKRGWPKEDVQILRWEAKPSRQRRIAAE